MPPTNTKNYLRFEDVSHLYLAKTKRIEIFSHWGSQIGVIRWYTPWRKYCFYPFDSTIFDVTCLQTIQNKINELMEARKNDNHGAVGEQRVETSPND